MTVTMGEALNRALHDAMAADDSVLMFGEDVGRLGGVFRVTDGLTAEFGESRCFDTPLAESGIVGTAVGMAMYGFRPVVEMQFDAFAYPAFEQITSHVAKLRNRTRSQLTLPLVIRIPYGRRYWRSRASLRLLGGVLHPHARPDGAHAERRGRRLLDAARGHRDARPVIFLEPKRRYWAKADIELPVTTEPAMRAVVRRAGPRRHSHRLRGDGRHSHRGGQCGPPTKASIWKSSISAASRPSTPRPWRLPSGVPAGRSSCTKPAPSAASGQRSWLD